jgi:ornithine decarboxylase
MDSMTTANHIGNTPVYSIPDEINAEIFTKLVAEQKSEQCNDDPFYIVDVGVLYRQYEFFRRELPRVAPFYAVKCNNDPLILEVLWKLGCGFDCASKPEIEQVMGLGVCADQIIYANPCKTASHLRFAAKAGVSLMTFDSESELHKVARLYPDARLVLRILVSDPTAVCQLNLKFGADPVTLAPELLRVAAELGLKVVGISFHVGSGCRDPTAFGEAIGHAHRLMSMGADLGHTEMNILDIGGGFPGFPTDEITFEEIARVVNENLDRYFPLDTSKAIKIIAEPGRFFAAAAYTLCCNVISAKTVPAKRIAEEAQDDETGYFYYLNDGAYGSFNCILYDHAVPYCYAVGKPAHGGLSCRQHYCSVWGPTCDSFDCIMSRARLPRLDAGDWLIFSKMGAYTIAAYSISTGLNNRMCSTFADGKTGPESNVYLPNMRWLELRF